MKTSHSLSLAILLSASTLAVPAHAQFSGALKRLSGDNDAPAQTTVAVPDEAAQEVLVQRFARSQTHSLAAQIAFAQAFGLAEQVQLLEAERVSLSAGAVNSDTLKKSVSVSEAAQAAIDERANAQPELNAEAHGHYAEGLIQLAQSVGQARQLAMESSSFLAGMKNLNPMQMASLSRKLSAGAWVAKESPGYVRALSSNTRMAMTYARQNKVKMPDNADSLLDGLE